MLQSRSIHVSCRWRQTTPRGADGSAVNKAVDLPAAWSDPTILLLDIFRARLPPWPGPATLGEDLRIEMAKSPAAVPCRSRQGRMTAPVRRCSRPALDSCESRLPERDRPTRNLRSAGCPRNQRNEESMQRVHFALGHSASGVRRDHDYDRFRLYFMIDPWRPARSRSSGMCRPPARLRRAIRIRSRAGRPR